MNNPCSNVMTTLEVKIKITNLKTSSYFIKLTVVVVFAFQNPIIIGLDNGFKTNVVDLWYNNNERACGVTLKPTWICFSSGRGL